MARSRPSVRISTASPVWKAATCQLDGGSTSCSCHARTETVDWDGHLDGLPVPRRHAARVDVQPRAGVGPHDGTARRVEVHGRTQAREDRVVEVHAARVVAGSVATPRLRVIVQQARLVALAVGNEVGDANLVAAAGGGSSSSQVEPITRARERQPHVRDDLAQRLERRLELGRVGRPHVAGVVFRVCGALRVGHGRAVEQGVGVERSLGRVGFLVMVSAICERTG